MGINECSKPASKSSWDSQDFGDVNMVLKMVHFRMSSRPQWVKKKIPYAKNWKFPWTKHLLWQNMKVLILVGDSLPLLFFHKVPVIKWEFRFID